MPEYDDYDQRGGYEDEYDGGSSRDSQNVQAAMSRVSLPGMILLIFGVIGLLFQGIYLLQSLQNPDILYKQLRSFVDSMEEGEEKVKAIKQIEEAKEDLMMNNPVNRASAAIGAVINLFMIVGGMQMRKLGSYPLSIVGAICGIIPCGGCACCALPIGIWALIVLLNSEVKAGFAAVARGRG